MDLLILTSHGLRNEYKENFLSLLSLPSGFTVTYRYREQLIEESLRAELAKRPASNNAPTYQVLFVHVYESDKKAVSLPCRYGKVIGTPKKIGTAYQFNIRLGSFAYLQSPPDAGNWFSGFTESLQAATDKKLSFDFKTGENETACIVAKAIGKINAISPNDGGETWERIVSGFKTSPIFEDMVYFYRIERIFKNSCNNTVLPKNGCLYLLPGTDYTLEIFHYTPNNTNSISGSLAIRSNSENVVFSTNPLLRINCPYDTKYVRFKTGYPVKADNGYLSLTQCGPIDIYSSQQDANTPPKIEASGGTEQYPWVRDIPLEIRGTLGIKIVYGLFVGLLLWLTAFLGTLANSPSDGSSWYEGINWVLAATSLIAALIAGQIVIHNLKSLQG